MNPQKDRRVLAVGRYLCVLRHNGWEWVERTNCSHAVVVAAVTDKHELVLIEQYRIPLGCRVIELPAGLVGDAVESRKESLLEAARRELLEETGYEAAHMDAMLEGPSSSGLTNEVFTLLLARNVRRVGLGGGDDTEDIQVHVVPLDQVPAWLESKRREGLMVSPKIYMGLYFLDKHGAANAASHSVESHAGVAHKLEPPHTTAKEDRHESHAPASQCSN